MINYSYILVGLIAFLDITLGLMVYLRDRKNVVNYSFFGMTFWAMVWIISNFLENEPFFRSLSHIFLRIDFASAFLLGYYFFLFCLNFPERVRFSLYQKIILFSVPVAFFILSFSDFVIKEISFYDQTIKFERGRLYWVYAFMLISYMAIGCFSLISKFKNLRGLEKIQAIYILFGLTISGTLAVTINLIITQLIPISADINRLGIYGVIFFIIFTAYAIIKHHLMDIKVIATELLVGLVAMILLIDIFTSKSYLVVALKLGILVIFIYLGIALIRGVLKELGYREKIQRALEIEKKALIKEKNVRKELERLNKAKTQFMMATQHHLRTPLTSMQGYLDLIFGGSYGEVPPKLKEVLDKFAASTRNEIKIVNDFLDISQFQMGKDVVFLRDGVDMAAIVREAVSDVEIEAKAKGIFVKSEISGKALKARADEQKLKAAVYNIVDNAVKYTRQGGVTVSLKENGNKLQVIVKDTGVGLSKEEKGKLFGKLFERGDQAQKIFTTGRGIGLYITYKIIEGHKGRVWVESEGRGKGSSFYIEIPRSNELPETNPNSQRKVWE